MQVLSCGERDNDEGKHPHLVMEIDEFLRESMQQSFDSCLRHGVVAE